MKSLLAAFLLLSTVIAADAADELHMRDGTVILGSYIGGTQKEVYFQRPAAGTDMYPLFMVESVKFNATPILTPGAQTAPAPSAAPGLSAMLATRVKWA